ncbi:MAG: bifunctional 4-hydroxy-2-oxoglutarate aldolase/2-dehydro-3-deoxy-phosphogluconate aldolase [Clostridia bacterium]|nr:bifunctional 4-hydroxy-2-oxoglutarate aldolase/2-dehydro-3-deoxy-phosphogluconate aldolase [Clostridia bacterium]
MNAREIVEQIKIVPVVKIDNLNDTLPLMKALCDGGIPIAEITFRTSCAADAIKLASENFGDKMLVGAGTVINATQAKLAVENGAKFIVSPGFAKEISDVCNEAGITYIPGCVTPTEIMAAISCGHKIIKFFPASNYGGVQTIKALSAPFGDIVFIPTGGVNASNINDFLAVKSIIACGGSWMVKDSLVKEGKFDEIVELCKEAVRVIGG